MSVRQVVFGCRSLAQSILQLLRDLGEAVALHDAGLTQGIFAQLRVS
jgi:hypothetical protein